MKDLLEVLNGFGQQPKAHLYAIGSNGILLVRLHTESDVSDDGNFYRYHVVDNKWQPFIHLDPVERKRIALLMHREKTAPQTIASTLNVSTYTIRMDLQDDPDESQEKSSQG